LLFIQKLPEEELEELNKKGYFVFMAVAEKIGYDVRGRTIFRRDNEGNVVKDNESNPVVDTDVPEIVKAFEMFKREYGFDF